MEKCYNCGKKGHYARDCWCKKVEERNQQEELVTCHSNKEEKFTLVIVSEKLVDYEHEWIVDSGCSNYMTSDEKKIINMSDYKGGQVIVTVNNSKMSVTHMAKRFSCLIKAQDKLNFKMSTIFQTFWTSEAILHCGYRYVVTFIDEFSSEAFLLIQLTTITQNSSCRKRLNILITGTPGTGKTTTAASMAVVSELRHINVGDFANEENLTNDWDDTFDCYYSNEELKML
ncbi:hypothetical protein H5410_052284 [Solanum commersonii]|uniref:CCHC-type domain-containing protein n=1 Tax=Solanum commersonii TaxID=4109 RepID=A0A9J5X0E5_SOLCO|nr:hypothetical protein H5410_052284 [Solanum commersonii]